MAGPSYHPPKISVADQLFRLFDQAGATSPLCQANPVPLLKFDVLDNNVPGLDELRNFIRQKTPCAAMPALFP